MRITRFINNKGAVCHGIETQKNHALLLNGSVAEGFCETTTEAGIAKRLAPLTPLNILCIGLNYRDHAQETRQTAPTQPILFMKNSASLNHPDADIEIPAHCLKPPQVDYEGELAVIIGKAAKNVCAEQALNYVFGYTIANDISARSWQKLAAGGQWVRGKSFDTFCPLGPVMLTADEIPDPQMLMIETRLNGERMQYGSTANMIFSIATLIEFLSSGMTLLPGTVILTGTPAGVGAARNPQIFLKPGDAIEITIDGIGSLFNPVIAAP